LVCGIDEAGRGALLGPIVAGAVILPANKIFKDFNDSKRLKSKEREDLYSLICKKAVCWGTGIVDVKIINRYGIQSATYLAYHMAIKSLKVAPDHLLIDHYRLPGIDISQTPITKGDSISQSIAAASIVAKVTRDALMARLAKDLKGYGLDRNFGYGTQRHIEAIVRSGPTNHHRQKFIPVDKILQREFNFCKKSKK